MLAVVFACNSAKTAHANSLQVQQPVMADQPREVELSESVLPAEVSKVAKQTAKLISSPVLNETEYKGKLAFQTECIRCHELPEVGQFSKKAWVKILPDMQKKGKTSPEIMQLIEAYVFAHFEKQ